MLGTIAEIDDSVADSRRAPPEDQPAPASRGLSPAIIVLLTVARAAPDPRRSGGSRGRRAWHQGVRNSGPHPNSSDPCGLQFITASLGCGFGWWRVRWCGWRRRGGFRRAMRRTLKASQGDRRHVPTESAAELNSVFRRPRQDLIPSTGAGGQRAVRGSRHGPRRARRAAPRNAGVRCRSTTRSSFAPLSFRHSPLSLGDGRTERVRRMVVEVPHGQPSYVESPAGDGEGAQSSKVCSAGAWTRQPGIVACTAGGRLTGGMAQPGRQRRRRVLRSTDDPQSMPRQGAASGARVMLRRNLARNHDALFADQRGTSSAS